jgi:glycine cleavage system H lipoate-binding protein
MHDFLDGFTIKSAEYLIAVSFLVLFVPFWRFVMGPAKAVEAVVHAAVPVRPAAPIFQVPAELYFHPGHAWARMDGGKATVGLDDFAQKLVGPIRALKLPKPGSQLRQGERAFKLLVGDKEIDLLSPVDGKVASINRDLGESTSPLKTDPYGTGWLVQVDVDRPEADRKNLLHGRQAQRWMDGAWEDLQKRMGAESHAMAADGGTPVDGLAQAIDPEHWDALARTLLLS